MTRNTTKLPAPFALMSSTLVTIPVSVTPVWLATSAYAPTARPERSSPLSVSPQVPVPAPLPPFAHSCRRRLDRLTSTQDREETRYDPPDVED